MQIACLGDFEDDATPGKSSKSGGAGGRKSTKQKSTGDTNIGGAACFLCGDGGDLTNRFAGYELHHGCHLGVRCHRGLLRTAEARTADNKKLEDDPEQWKAEVRPLADFEGEKRPRSAVLEHAEKVKNKTYTERCEAEGQIFLTKQISTK